MILGLPQRVMNTLNNPRFSIVLYKTEYFIRLLHLDLYRIGDTSSSQHRRQVARIVDLSDLASIAVFQRPDP